MVIVNSDIDELIRLGYIDKKYGHGLYLPGRRIPYHGEGIADFINPIANFITTNKDTIKAVADTTGKIATLGSSTVDMIKQIKRTSDQKKEFDKIRKEVRNNGRTHVGEGFKILK